jgi:DNA-binding MarR family transcriptional regulator
MTHIGDLMKPDKLKRRPRYTLLLHDVRQKFGLSVNTYIVIDSIHKLSTNNRHFPYCVMSKEDLADFLGIARATVFRAIKEAEELGLIEREPNKGLRSTDKWINTVEMYRLDADR